MGKVVALLSGKGGSGKTSLALSMTYLLADCGLRILLIDCDFATNGATYFYEEKISSNNETPDFASIFLKGKFETTGVISVSDNVSFIPSITRIEQEKKANKYIDIGESYERVKMMLKYFKDRYDIIIMDCQAGYSDVLDLILPNTDVNLLVLEADAISASAIRSFYLKCGNMLEKSKVYQVINKATEEEYETYSKISSGTLFVNVETVKFDWKIRNAFALAQIPDLKTSGFKYGEQVYHICKNILRDSKIQESLKNFELVIAENALREERVEIQKKIDDVNKEKISNYLPIKNMSYLSLCLLASATIGFLFFYVIKMSLSESAIFSGGSFGEAFALIISMFALFSTVISSYALFRERRKKFDVLSELYKKQRLVDEKLNIIEQNKR